MRLVLQLIASLLILGAGVAGFFVLTTGDGKPRRKAAEVEQAPVVNTWAVEIYRDPLTITVDGLTVPYREIEVAAEVSGRIESKAEACRAGRYVTRGTHLITIDRKRYELEVERLSTLVEQATDNLEEKAIEMKNVADLIVLARDEVKLHQRDLDRVRGLRSSGAATQSALDEAERVVLRGRNALVVLQNRERLCSKQKDGLNSAVAIAGRQLELAELDLNLTRLEAPVHGVIVRDLVEEGAFVQKGTPLYVIEDVAQVDVLCSLRMDDLYWLWQQEGRQSADGQDADGRDADGRDAVGQDADGQDADGRDADGRGTASRIVPGDYEVPKNCEVEVEYSLAGRKYRWSGELSRYDGIGLDEKTRTIRCRVSVAEPTDVKFVDSLDGHTATPLDSLAAPAGPPALIRGMFVTVKIKVKIKTTPRSTLLQVPEQAIYPGNVVWAVAAGRLQRRRVTIAAVIARGDGDWAILDAARSEVVESDWVVTSPISTETTSTAVREQRQTHKDQPDE